ncbi:hypothetical protein [Streptomyces sp. NPDC046805]|uniref:hypothetical protein n=1 Tax=Streptomyces sp. NPDC046805 TaxID=3155134 RepID=UPI0033D52569
MSDTTIADRLTGLSPAVISIYTQLVAFTEPVTVDDIAQAAATARSSTFKALVALEKQGLAHRDRGIQNGPNRRPDLWRATDTDTNLTPDGAPTGEELAKPISGTTPTSEPGGGTTSPMMEPGEPTAHDPEENSDASESEPAGSTAPLPAQHTGTAEQPSPTSPTAVSRVNKRLAPGGLRQLVIDHLNAHPREAFTATRISRMIDRSSGAIANALATLAKQGLAEQVNDRPRAYRAAAPESAA